MASYCARPQKFFAQPVPGGGTTYSALPTYGSFGFNADFFRLYEQLFQWNGVGWDQVRQRGPYHVKTLAPAFYDEIEKSARDYAVPFYTQQSWYMDVNLEWCLYNNAYNW